MLKALRIRNLAIIDEASLEFGPGFIVLTGETGAGKSILIDGLNLALGERADKEMIRAGRDEVVVEALFDVSGLPQAKDMLASMEIEADDSEVLLRRVVTSAGRTRSAVNGTPVPLGFMKKLGDLLVDLHGQHEHQLLLDERTHLEFLDAFGGLLPDRAAVREAFRSWKSCRDELERISGEGRDRAQRLDLLNYQINEIDAARLKPGEDRDLAAEKSRLANVQKLTEALSGAHEALVGESGAHERLGQAASALKGAVEFDREAIGSRADALSRLMDAVRDEGAEVRDQLEKLEDDPGRLEEVEERLDVISRLCRKYGDAVESVLEFAEKARAEASGLSASEESIAELKTRLEQSRGEMAAKALKLSADRRKVARKFSEEVARQLRELAMERAEFSVGISDREDAEGGPVEKEGRKLACTAEGVDAAEFHLAPNPGEGAKPLGAIASGGELSRIMLAIKSVLARVDRVGTLVYDEIDSGIGGRAAEVAGRKLFEIGQARQVLCITHLPQIAARANEHVAVVKRTGKKSAAVEVTRLDGENRVAELARMLAGEAVTPTALKHAEALLRDR